MINSNLGFMGSMQFIKSSLDLLVTNLMSEDLKYLSEEYSVELLKLVKEKGVYLYEYIDSPDKCNFFLIMFAILLK